MPCSWSALQFSWLLNTYNLHKRRTQLKVPVPENGKTNYRLLRTHIFCLSIEIFAGTANWPGSPSK